MSSLEALKNLFTRYAITAQVKHEFSTIKNNSCWLIGNGKKTNFWHDSWCGDPLAQVLNIPSTISQSFPSFVCSYISNHHWSIPSEFCQTYPGLANIVNQVQLPTREKDDNMVWKHNSTGTLSLKEAYEFKRTHFPKPAWTKDIWFKDIPPC